MHLIGTNPSPPAQSFPKTLEAGICFHSLSDGTWNLIDVIRWLVDVSDVDDLLISTWTASRDGVDGLLDVVRSSDVGLRFLIDFSFRARQPDACAHLREAIGDDRIRVWNSHCKFIIGRGDTMSVLILTSANLNRNIRLENYSLLCVKTIVDQYVKLVDKLFQLQHAGDGFVSAGAGRSDTKKILFDESTDSMKDIEDPFRSINWNAI